MFEEKKEQPHHRASTIQERGRKGGARCASGTKREETQTCKKERLYSPIKKGLLFQT